MSKAETFTTTDGAAVASKNKAALAGISRQVEELLRIRREADEMAARLIDLLDLEEIDPDLEPAGDEEDDDRADEPSLGWTSTINQTSRNRLGGIDDVEQDDADREPSLGVTERHPSAAGWQQGANPTGDQTWWGFGGRDDRENEDEREPDHEGVDGATADPAYYAGLKARRAAGRPTP